MLGASQCGVRLRMLEDVGLQRGGGGDLGGEGGEDVEVWKGLDSQSSQT